MSTLILIKLCCLLVAVVIHEISHGYVAYLYGDPTAKQQGRLSLNPIRHIDPVGSIIIPLILMLTGSPAVFGWAKPVPVQPNYFSKPRFHMMLVALAGPLSNISLAIVSGMLLQLLKSIPISILYEFPLFFSVVLKTLIYFIQLNIVLAVFNLIPIPPLDGSRILSFFLPQRISNQIDRLEPYGFLIIYLCLFLDIIPKILQITVLPLIRILTPL